MELFSRPLLLARSVLHKNLTVSACLYKTNEKSGNALYNAKQAHTTIDAADIQKHAESVNEWWDPNGKIKPLHSFNQIRVPFIRDGLVQCSPEERTATPLKGKVLLDIGCGGGILSEALARLGAQVTGVDAGKEVIEVAKEHCQIDPRLANNRPTYICTSIEEHAVDHKSHYDGVVASEVIEHITDKELFVKCCVETLKPGGKIFFTTPARTRLSQLLGIFVAEYVLNIVPRGTHQYEKFITPNELTFLLERNNCHVEIIHGVSYNPITNKWSFCSSQQMLFALQAAKIK